MWLRHPLGTSSMKFTLRQRIGGLIFDAPRYLYHLHRKSSNGGPAWLQIRNRDEQLETSEAPFGVKCKWEWTSDLYLPTVFPSFAKKLFGKALSSYRFKLTADRRAGGTPDVSFIIGHRGSARIDLLLKTIDSIAAQSDCAIECIVVEQDDTPIIRDRLPEWVTYVFTPVSQPTTAYSRSWAFNVGARHANSQCLIFHDNDLLIPSCYANETLLLFQRGFDFINLKRFIFYLSKEATDEVINNGTLEKTLRISTIMQNAEGGGSIGASKQAYQRIGGFDERFVGWGSEDNEFWERALTQNVWVFGYLPLVHLWHGPQAEKLDIEGSSTKALYKELSKQSPENRIATLKQRATKRKSS